MTKHSKPLSAEAKAHIENLRQRRQASRLAAIDHAVAQRVAIFTLADQKLSCRDIAHLIGISHQRVNQILKEKSLNEDDK